MRRSLSYTFAQNELQAYFKRPNAMLTLKKHEVPALAERMFGGRAEPEMSVELALAA